MMGLLDLGVVEQRQEHRHLVVSTPGSQDIRVHKPAKRRVSSMQECRAKKGVLTGGFPRSLGPGGSTAGQSPYLKVSGEVMTRISAG